MDKQYKYDAFISYRHTEPDKTVATKLQKMLESYKPPKSVCNDFKQWHIFRDETELPTSSNLSGDIKEALENSKFLIVICSKKTKESRWCMEEITYFKELHKGNNSNIITLIVDGEPAEVFPDELCTELIPVKDDVGNISYQSHVIEPLAASVAAKSTKESLKKLKTEFLRIAAPLLGCGYDTLYNRNQKRHVRRLLAIATFIMTFLFAFGLYTSAMLLEINAQKSALQVANDNLKVKTEELDKSNKELQETNINLEKKTKEAQDNLEEANKQRAVAEKNLVEAEKQRQIAEKNLEEANRQKKIAEDNLAEANRQQKIAQENADEAERQKNTAEKNMLIAQENEAKANEQTRLAQIENSQNLSALSESLWNSGDGITAIQTALSALPSNEVDRPIVPNATRVLANEIGAFKQENFSTIANLKCDDHITQIAYAGNGSTIVCKDSTGIYFWDSKTGILKKKFTNEMFECENYNIELYFDNTNVYKTLGAYKHAVGIYLRNENNYIEGYKKEKEDREVLSSTDVLVKTSSSIYKINGLTGEIMWEIGSDDIYANYVDITNSEIIVSDALYDDNYKKVGAEIKVFDRLTGELVSTFETDSPDLEISTSTKWIDISDDKAYYHYDGYSENKIIAFDIVGNKLTNSRVLYDSAKDPLYIEYDYTVFDKIEMINDEIYILKSHWDNTEYTFITDLIVIDKNGKTKWTYSYKNDFTHGNHVRVEIFNKDICKNFCDVLAVTKGNRIVFLESETGEHIFTYELDSLVKNSYCSKDGFLTVLTAEGYEVAVLARNIEKGVYDETKFPMIQLNKFMSQHNLYECFNHSYAVSNSNSNDVYLYSNVQNEEYQKIFADDDSINEIHINDAQTHIAIDSYKEVYIYDINSGSAYELVKSEEYLQDTMFLSDYLYVVIDAEYTIKIFDIRTKELVYTKKCERLSSISSGVGYSYALVVDGNLIIQENYKEYSVINDNFELVPWNPKKLNTSGENKWNEGDISKIYASDEFGKILIKVRYGYESDKILEIYDINTENMVTLDVNLSMDDTRELDIVSVNWQNDKTVLVAFSDNTVKSFDIGTGICNYSHKCDLPSIVSVISLGNDAAIGLLCNDSKLYKIETATGNVLDSVDINNYYVKTASSDSTETKIIPEHNSLIISGWNEEFGVNHAYIVDLETFDVSYDVDGYADYYGNEDRLIVENYNVVGSYPLYTVRELVEKAQNYISQ